MEILYRLSVMIYITMVIGTSLDVYFNRREAVKYYCRNNNLPIPPWFEYNKVQVIAGFNVFVRLVVCGMIPIYNLYASKQIYHAAKHAIADSWNDALYKESHG